MNVFLVAGISVISTLVRELDRRFERVYKKIDKK